MQRLTDGMPAKVERRASAWQYWQSILKSPAWILWLKRMGCFGAGAIGACARRRRRPGEERRRDRDDQGGEHFPHADLHPPRPRLALVSR